MQEPTESFTCLELRSGLAVDGSAPSADDVEGADARSSGWPSYEKKLLDEIDSYWDDLNTRLTISRMVNDSVIKGMVNAVSEEAAEKITLKEAEVAFLTERLQQYESDSAEVDSIKTNPESCSLNSSMEHGRAHCLEKLWVAAEEQLCRLKEGIRSVSSTSSLGDVCSDEKLHVIDDCSGALEVILSAIDKQVCSLKASANEQQLEQEIQNLMRCLQVDLETKLCEERGLITTANTTWREKVGELSALRQELDAISKYFFSTESGLIVTRSSLESSDDCNTSKRKDHFSWKVIGNPYLTSPSRGEENGATKLEEAEKPTSTESPQLKSMPKEELIAYFKTEMTKMKRQHDLALQEKTEELFILKREIFKEKGSIPLHIRRDKEFELLIRKIPEFMVKLDDVIKQNENAPAIHEDQAMLGSLKKRIDNLLFQNRRLQGLLQDKTKEASLSASQVSDVENQLSNYSLVKEKFINRIADLQSNLEDTTMEAAVRDEIYMSILSGLVPELKSDMEDLELMNTPVIDIYSMIYREFVRDALSNMDLTIADLHEEMDSIATRLLEKDKALSSEVEENKKFKQELASLMELMEEKEKHASKTESTLIQQKEHFDLVCQELNMLKDRLNEQEGIILERKKESDLTRDRLDAALEKIHRYEVYMDEINQKLRTVSDALEETEKQKTVLYSDIREKENAVATFITLEKEQKKRMETITSSLTDLSRAIMDCECRLMDGVKTNESRLILLNQQCIQLVQHAALLKKEELWYKEIIEKRCSDLQKAEIEVDLLGDEVDTLLSLLERIYVALDHYSPVLEHYPGIVEILKLIRRELKEEVNKFK